MKLLGQCFAATALVASVGFSSVAFADGTPLPVQDSFTKTIIDKSVVSGAVDGMDAKGNYTFDYTGKVYSVETNSKTGQLTELEKAIGTIEGQAAFPQEFVDLAMGAIGMLKGGPAPAMPAVIPWTCNKCTMKVGANTYTSVINPAVSGQFPDGSAEAMRMQGRAFTGLGPVEMTKISPMSLSVRMAGCSAVVATEGPDADAGMVGTICLNGTFTFDLATAADPTGLKGTGTSNCITVLHKPIMPLK